jgi:hypothetical protein
MRLFQRTLAALRELQGPGRHLLLMVTTLYFAILFLESAVGHTPAVTSNWRSLALLPAVWMPVSLLTLMAALVRASRATELSLQVAMIVAGVIGFVGVSPHLVANGVTWARPEGLLNGSALHGEPGPTWPLAITIGAVLGFVGSVGLGADRAFTRTSGPSSALRAAAFVLLLAAILLSRSVTTLGWCGAVTVAAAALLFVHVLADIAAVLRQRRA